MTTNQCHDVTNVGRIHHDTMPFPYIFLKHDVIEVDSLLEDCSVIMLDLQILIRSPSVYPNKKFVCH